MYSGMMADRGLLTVMIFATLSISQGVENCSEPCLIYTAENRIDAIELASSRVVKLVSNLTFPVNLDVHVSERTLYWSDSNQRVIKRMNMSSGVTKDIITEDHGNVGDLAVEWESRLLYWTDTFYRRIEVSSLDGSKRKVLLAESSSYPAGIAVHPKKGWMFWTDVGLTTKIERANLAGFERTVLVDLTKSSQFWPYAICVDYTNDRIVWVDAFSSVVESADLQGGSRRMVASQVSMHPRDLILYGDTFYWSDWREDAIEMLNWTTGDYLGNFSAVISGNFYGLSLLDKSREAASAENQLCKIDNGGCSYLCLLTPNGSLCACPDGIPLSTDGKGCLPVSDIKRFLLFAEGSNLRQMAFNATSSRRISLKIPASQPIALDFDFVEEKVYWTDVSLGTISRAYLNGSSQETVVTGGIKSPYGLAVDPFGQNIYWTDSAVGVIGVASTDGHYRRVLISDNLQDPRDIILDVTRGYIYWTDWGWNEKIEQVDMDGTNRRVIVRLGLFYPNGLTLDFQRNWLYWIDNFRGELEVYEIPSNTRRTIINSYGEPFLKSPLGLTLYESHFFWTDQRLNGVYQADRDTGRNASKVLSTFSQPGLIHAYDKNMNITPVTDECADKNGGCDQLCLLSPRGKKCLCSVGFNLQDDGKGCGAQREILLYVDYSTDHIMRVSPHDSGSRNRLPFSNINSPIALDYDKVEDRLYWTQYGKISRAFLNGSSQEIITDTNLYNTYGLAVDSVGRNLYWTNAGKSMLEVSKLDGSRRMALMTHNINQPRDIILDVYKGVMYWTNQGSNPKIEKAEMTGRKRVVIVNSGLSRPNGLTLDRKRNRLYWLDGGYRNLEYLDFNQNKRVVLLSHSYNLYYSFGLTILGDYLYWTSTWYSSRGVYRADKETGNGITKFISSTGWLQGIRGYNLSEPFTTGNSSCLGNCSHICLLSPNGSECACPGHFTLGEDGKTCEHDIPEKILLFADASRSQIYTLSLDESNTSAKLLPMTHQMYYPVALDFDITEDRIYWTESSWPTTISRVFINGSSPETVISKGVKYPYGLAVDPVGRNIYWTDRALGKIEVSRMDGSIRKTLISRDLDSPRDIIVDLDGGLMYWSDWGTSHKIEVAGMDGNNRSTLVKRGLYSPNGLTLDSANKRLYWVDAWFHVLEYYDLERHTITTVLQDRNILWNPFGLTLFEDYIYWTDSSLGVVYQAPKDSPSNATALVNSLWSPRDIHAYDRNQSLPDHPCSLSFGGCSHLCLLRPNGYKCACPDNLKLSKDEKTCIPQTYIFQKFLLFADSWHAQIFILDLDDSNLLVKVLPIGAFMYRPHALGMDIADNRVYWTDVSLNSIRRAFINGTSPEVVVSVNVSNPAGLAVDPVGGNIYWSDTVTKRIEVSRMDGAMRKVLIDKDLDQPRDIVLDTSKGFIYWCDRGTVPKIETANMDGSSRRILVKRALYWPSGLTLDEANNRLYWVDSYLQIFEYYDFKRHTVTTVIKDGYKLPYPFGLTLLESHLYWTDWSSRVVYRAEQKTLSNRTVVVSGLGQPMDIHAYDRSKLLPDHPCSKSYGGCSHLCLLRPDGYRCSCPD
ncbi:low-density lipoprotein receptor-related protein 4-like isoform X2 [Stylophora pistillata]|uniref:low-density lipoprotein receptor-related protein 4-like isoform X2 n=1 Tax=Stylophora pistillata TaxID=50429 RepID=UPI000C0516C7|nr:low-density lipoprotein receptor-related protein 4-like isoform X2 [Stylophora pistillata]